MTIELRRRDTIFRRTDLYAVADSMPRIVDGAAPEKEFEPDFVRVDMDRDGERAPWTIEFVTAKGRRILKGGVPGVAQSEHCWNGKGLATNQYTPQEVVKLAAKALKVAESERLGGTPPCPNCGKALLLADPVRPEEWGEYCEPCGQWFVIPLPWDSVMTSSLPVALPNPINETTIELGLTLTACRTCPATMDGWRADDDPTASYEWRAAHHEETGHSKFHVWRIDRNNSFVFVA